MSPRLTWDEVLKKKGGGAIPAALAPEVESEAAAGPDGDLSQINDWLHQARELFGQVKDIISQVDAAVGFFLNVKGQENEVMGQDPPGLPPGPAPAGGPDARGQLIDLLEGIIKSRGDLRLTELIDSLKNMAQGEG